MAGPVWIKGKALDGRHTQDFERHAKFVSYLVHLGSPACTIVAGRYGFLDETKIKCAADAGFFYRKSTSDLDLVILEWHGHPPSSEAVIGNLLYEAASHLLIERLSALESEALGA